MNKTDTLLADLIAEVRINNALLQRIAHAVEQRHARPANVTDSELALLRAIAEHARNEHGVPLEFSTADVIKHARSANGMRLHDALVEAHGDPNSKKVGKLLARVAGDSGSGIAADIVVERLGKHRNGATWIVKTA